MAKWKVIVPVLAVVAIAAIMMSRTSPDPEPVPAPDIAMREDADVAEGTSTGEEDIDEMVDDILIETEVEAEAAEAAAQEGDIAAEAEGDNELFTGAYYEE